MRVSGKGHGACGKRSKLAAGCILHTEPARPHTLLHVAVFLLEKEWIRGYGPALLHFARCFLTHRDASQI